MTTVWRLLLGIQYADDACTVAVVMLLQPLNMESPKEVMLPSIVTLVSDEQLSNAQEPISVTLSGKLMLTRLEQPLKACPAIYVTPSGMFISLSCEHPAKADIPMPLIESGSSMLVRFVQCINTYPPMEDRLFESVTFERDVQELNT